MKKEENHLEGLMRVMSELLLILLFWVVFLLVLFRIWYSLRGGQ